MTISLPVLALAPNDNRVNPWPVFVQKLFQVGFYGKGVSEGGPFAGGDPVNRDSFL